MYGIKPWLEALNGGEEVHVLTRELFKYRRKSKLTGVQEWLPWYDGVPTDYHGDGMWSVEPGGSDWLCFNPDELC